MEKTSSNLIDKNYIGEQIVKKTKHSSYRGFISIDQEMGKEISLMFFHPSNKNAFSKTGHLAGKL